jgi:hypothetical protein
MRPEDHWKLVVGYFFSFCATVLTWAFLMPPAHAGMIYTWEGECVAGCSEKASATLIFNDGYTAGAPFTVAPDNPLRSLNMSDQLHTSAFVQFTGTETVGIGYLFIGGGTLPDHAGGGLLNLCFNSCFDNKFLQLADGSWQIHTENGGIVASGINGLFSPQVDHVLTISHVGTVPEPATWALLIMALFLMQAVYFGGKAIRGRQ